MDNSTSRSANSRTFCDSDYSDSDYLHLARTYRNQEGAAIVVEMFKTLSEAASAKFKFKGFSVLKRA